MGLNLNSFSNTKETGLTTEVTSFSELESIILNGDVNSVLLTVNMDLDRLMEVASNLFIMDIKLEPEKTRDGWLFKIERGI